MYEITAITMENIKKERNPKDMTVEYEKGPPRLGNRA
jgi:hypothetical protein